MTKQILLILTSIFLITACVRRSPDAGTFTETPAATVEPSQTPLPPTATLEPPTPTATVTLAYILGLLVVQVPDQDEHPFVFLIDAYTWQQAEPAGCPDCPALAFQHWDQAGCSLQLFPAATPAAEDTGTLDLAGRTWQVERSQGGNRMHFSAVWSGQFRLDALAQGILDPTCRADVEELLAGSRLTWEALAMRLPSGLPTPEPLPLPADYACESLAPRLQVGVTAQVVADSIWVRSEPRRAADTQILLLYKDLPVALIVNAGPVCAEGLTFWNVRYYAGAEFSGWIAESDSGEYFLEPLAP
jgi:hypothetical protein